ncbi:MAG TPA: hypothetical protein PKI11_15505, partial [Candidatus Hydrogenedentes bacterium]|nr:hypothetical protein [Candidatus Hydrogenedentota bacterium]
MMIRASLMAVCAVMLCGVFAYGVEPAYRGQFGNPEEPALRPIKWLWHGTKSLVWHSSSYIRGGELKGVYPTVRENVRGVRRGSVALGESCYRGAIGARLPEKRAYRDPGHWNAALEAEFALRRDKESGSPDATTAGTTTEAPSGGEAERQHRSRQSWYRESRVDRARRTYLGDRA